MRTTHLILGALLMVNPFFLRAQVNRPNVLIILTDDQNTHDLGCYENKVHTPNIDALAAGGIKFTNANVVSSICSPSRYNINTGRYYNNCFSEEFLDRFPCGTASCVSNFIPLEKNNMNLPALLQKNGYFTGFVGKWHLSDHDMLERRNWEENGLKTYPGDSDPRVDQETNRKIKYNHDVWVDSIRQYGYDYVNGVYAANLREQFNDYLNSHNLEWTVYHALDFLEHQAGKADPFFLFINPTYPHGPAPERMVDGNYVYSLDNPKELTGEGVLGFPEVMPSRRSVKKRYNKLKVKNPDLSEKAITALWWDDAVGAIINTLEEKGLRENTLIIYLSDHGNFRGGKSSLYEFGVHIPMIINWPGGLGNPGSDYTHLVASIDIAPTVFDVCRIRLPYQMHMDGTSLKSVLLGSSGAVREALFLEMGYARAIKTERYKYIAVRYPEEIEEQIRNGKKFRHYDGSMTLDQPYLILHRQLANWSFQGNPNYFTRDQVYDLQADPEERTNLYGRNPDVDRDLASQMKEALDRFPHRPFGEFNTGL